ncbi:MAG TPA: discoidin domain-containing protein, partial [Sedimentisphaerales bacterium]|nr:discoidin domain-containing protein [Sedimentisphaerales bacterium]
MKKSLCFAAVGFVVLVCLPAQAKVLVYEPFDYPDGWLNGQGGALGTIGTWVTTDIGCADGWRVHPEGQLTGIAVDVYVPPTGGLNVFDGTVDNLPTTGGFAGMAGPEDRGLAFGTDGGTGNLDASIGLDPSVTASFQSGTTTWFSYVGAHAWDRNQGSPQFMICTDTTTNGSRGLSLINSGNGIGATGGPPRFNLFEVYPQYFSGGVKHQSPGGYLGGVFGAHDGIVTAFCSTTTCDGGLVEVGQPPAYTMAWQVSNPSDGSFGATNIVIGKIEWDADTAGEDIISVVRFLETDTLSEAAFDALIAAQPALSSRNWPSNKPDLDQSQFDTINISSLKFFIDEIRIATTFEDVVGGSPSKARDPQPEADETDVPRDLVLGWTPGIYANTHDVYLGTAFDDVNDASRKDPRGVLVRQGHSETTYDPGRLEFGTTYDWRIDEVNAPPDSTIYKGNVWSFTVEPVAYPISASHITATASSSNSATEGPVNTINGSGLDAEDLHSVTNTDMWLSSMTGAQPTWVLYEFDRVYKLYQIQVWNHNTLIETAIGLGIKEAAIEYSTDGATWTPLGTTHEFTRGPGAPGYAANTTVDLGGVAARYVKISANSNWGGILSQYGLSEVRFFSIPVLAREPDPASGTTDMAPDVTLNWRAGREATKHNVYLSTDEQAMIDGTAPVVTVTSPTYATSLDLASTYYWRVDEVNEAETPSTWQGDVWSLSTQEYLVVDDFESYNDIETGKEG